MEDPRIISALFIFLKMAYYNVLINSLWTSAYILISALLNIRFDSSFFSQLLELHNTIFLTSLPAAAPVLMLAHLPGEGSYFL